MKWATRINLDILKQGRNIATYIKNAKLMKRLPQNKPLVEMSSILLYILLTHGTTLLNKGIFWDGWVIYPNLLNIKDWGALWLIYYESGRPNHFYIHLLSTAFSDIIFGYRVIFIIAILLSTYSTYRLCQIMRLTANNAWLITALSVSFPSVLVGFEVILLPNIVDYSLFLCATWLFACAINHKPIATSESWQNIQLVLCTILYVVSFDTNSLLVYFYPFLVLFFIKSIYSNDRHNLAKDYVKYLLFFLLPVLWWVINHYFFPTMGLYENYNQFNFSKLGVNSLVFILFSAIVPFIESVTIFLRLPFLFLPIFAVITMIMVLFKRNFTDHQSVDNQYSTKQTLALMCFGAVLFAAGAFPYLVVGKFPIFRSWETRHAMLTILPISIMIVSVIQFIKNTLNLKYAQLIHFFIIFLLTSFSARHIENYLMWQARWVKDSTFMMQLSHHTNANVFSTYYVQDEWPINDHSLLYKYDSEYDFYEYAGMFRTVWGGQSRLGLDLKADDWHEQEQLVELDARYRTKEYNLVDFVPSHQCKATLILSKIDTRSDTKIALDYIVNQLINPDLNRQQLAYLSKLEVIPHPDNRCL